MDVIREFVLRGRMEILKADLAVPDIAAFTKQLQEQNQFAQQQAKFLDELIARQQQRDQAASQAEKESAKRRAAEAQAREEEKKAAAEKAKADADAINAEKSKQDAINATNKARDEAIRKDTEINTQLLKGGDALKQAGDGAFAFARGLTLIGLEGSSLEQVAKDIARVQGQFDLFRGGVDLLKGGIESARAFGKAMELAGGGVALLSSRLLALNVALGPTGWIVLGAVAATAAIIAIFEALSAETDEYLNETEDRMRDFVRTAEAEASRASAAFEREDAVRATLGQDQRISSIQTDIAGLGERTDASVFKAEADAFWKDFFRNMINMSEEEREATVAAQAAKSGGDISREISREERRQDLTGNLLSETKSKEEIANQERERGIEEAARAAEDTEKQIQQKQKDLRDAEAAEAERQRAIALERAQRSAADQAFVDRTSGNIGGASIKELQNLKDVAGQEFGLDVQDELTRRGGGTPAARVDKEAELAAQLAELTATLKTQRGAEGSLRDADAKLDAEAQASLDKLNVALRQIAENIESLSLTQAMMDSRFKEGAP